MRTDENLAAKSMAHSHAAVTPQEKYGMKIYAHHKQAFRKQKGNTVVFWTASR